MAKVPFEFPENGMELLWPTALDGDAAHAFLRDAIERVATAFSRPLFARRRPARPAR